MKGDQETFDWQAWHAGYDDPHSALSRRLRVVQSEIRRSLDRLPAGPWRAVSLCAGDGRDLLQVLTDHPRRTDVSARLVELDPRLTETASRFCRQHQLHGVDVLTADAGNASSYEGSVPADLVLACGVFGNLTADDAIQLVRALPQFCRPGGAVIWTRHRLAPDMTGLLRAELSQVGFQEESLHEVPDSSAVVGTSRWPGPPARFQPQNKLFTFTPDREQRWQTTP